MKILEKIALVLSALVLGLIAAAFLTARAGVTPKSAAIFAGIIVIFWLFYYLWIPFAERILAKSAHLFERSPVLRVINKVFSVSLLTWKIVFLVFFTIMLVFLLAMMIFLLIGKPVS